ncbi:hypothetical protein MTO96_030182, partial [Rhipicephalus appendiculatus]
MEIAEAQERAQLTRLSTTSARSTGGGRAPGFHGNVLQLTGTLRLTGVRPLDYQQIPSPLPRHLDGGLLARPGQPRARRSDVLTDMQSQCASSLGQGTDLLR